MGDLDIMNLMQEYGLAGMGVDTLMNNLQDKLDNFKTDTEHTDLKGKRMKEYPNQIFYGSGIYKIENSNDINECEKHCRDHKECSGGMYNSTNGNIGSCSLAKGNGAIINNSSVMNLDQITSFVKETTLLFEHYDKMEVEMKKLNDRIQHELREKERAEHNHMDKASYERIKHKLHYDNRKLNDDRFKIEIMKKELVDTQNQYNITSTQVESTHLQMYLWYFLAVCFVGLAGYLIGFMLRKGGGETSVST